MLELILKGCVRYESSLDGDCFDRRWNGKALSVGMGRTFDSICLSLVLSVCCLEHNSKTKDPKVFKLGIGNDLDILGVIWFWV